MLYCLFCVKFNQVKLYRFNLYLPTYCHLDEKGETKYGLILALVEMLHKHTYIFSIWLCVRYKEGMLKAKSDDRETIQLIEGAAAG